jgi:hypothetical protein
MMTLAEKLLPKLSEWAPAGDGRHSWAAAFPECGWTVRIAADKADSLSCLVWELALDRTNEAPVGLSVKDWATSVIERVGGLMEDLKLYEVDTTRNEAVLRSDTPAKRGEKLAYYEVVLQGVSAAVVRRFSATKSVPGREQTAFALTHEVLAKLAGDIVG